jgi:hypothetical protein
MKFGTRVAAFAAVCLLATALVGAEEATATKDAAKKVDLAKILKETKCPISQKPVKADKFATYKESKVYVCCDGCVKSLPAKAKKDTKLAALANHQLVMTHQAKQAKCCMNGKGPMKKATKVAGLEVKTCCNNCLGAIKKMEEKDQIAHIFGKTFDKAFVVKAQEAKKKAAEKKKAA